MGPNASEQVRASPKTLKKLRDRGTILKNIANNFEKKSEKLAHGLFRSSKKKDWARQGDSRGAVVNTEVEEVDVS